MTDDALARAREEIAKLKLQLKKMRQDLRKERASHRQTALKLGDPPKT